MNKKPTSAQEASLRKLFYGNHIEREQVISIQRPEMQAHMRTLMKAKGNTDKLLGILFSDLANANGQMKANPSDQFWRRTTIRTLAATVDGIVFLLKQNALAVGPMNGIEFNEKELFFLTEESSQPPSERKSRLPGFRDNFKGTFKMFAKAYKVECPIDFGQNGFTAFCETYELRHRLMHPKSFMTCCVTDVEKQRAGDAIRWLDNETLNLFSACHSLGRQ